MFICGACNHAPQVPLLKWRIPGQQDISLDTMNPVFYQDGILISQLLNDSIIEFRMLSIENGNTKWQCTDTAAVHKSFFSNLTTCQIGSVLFVPSGSVLLAIDLQAGKIKWKKTSMLAGEDHLSTDGTSLFRSYMRPDFSASYIYQIKAESGQHQLIDSVIFQGEMRGYARTPTCLSNNRLAFTYILQENNTKSSTCFLRFFDLNQMKSVCQDTIYPPNQYGLGVNKQGLYDLATQNLYLVAHDELITYNTTTYTLTNRIKCPRDILSSNIIFQQNAVYWPGEDGFLRKIDIRTKKFNWASAISGTPGKLFLYQGAIYVVGGGNGLFQVLDQEKGKVLYTLQTPNQRNYPHLHFERSMSVNTNLGCALLNDGKDFFLYTLP